MESSPSVLLEKRFGNFARDFDPVERRIAMEFLQLEDLCSRYSNLTLEVIGNEVPPSHFQVRISGLPSIARIDDRGKPEFRTEHLLDLKLPSSYPLEPPVAYMFTDAWHPNIQSEKGPFRGRICGNHPSFAATASLEDLVLRIVDMLAYKVYNADFTFPFPEDEAAAQWVLRFGEPLGIVRRGEGIISTEWPTEKANEISLKSEKYFSLG